MDILYNESDIYNALRNTIGHRNTNPKVSKHTYTWIKRGVNLGISIRGGYNRKGNITVPKMDFRKFHNHEYKKVLILLSRSIPIESINFVTAFLKGGHSQHAMTVSGNLWMTPQKE